MGVRSSKFDNLKAILIFLVVLGHFLELFGSTLQYRTYMVLYTFHMPFFVFLSGLFAKFNPKNILLKQIYPYIVFQILYCLFAGETVQFFEPYWLMWYLLAMAVWYCTVPLLQKAAGVWFVAALIAAIFVGFLPQIGYEASLSRIISFYPFFVLGVWFQKADFKMCKKTGTRLLASVCLIAAFFISYALLPALKTDWLYHALPYAQIGCTPVFRLALFGIAVLWIAGGVALMPDRPVKWLTNVGRYSLCVYLLHGFVQRAFLLYGNPFVFSDTANFCLALAFAVVLTLLLATKPVFSLLKPFTNLNFLIRWNPQNALQKRYLNGTALFAIFAFFCSILYGAGYGDMWQTLAITFFTCFYHLAMRLFVGLWVQKGKFSPNSFWFRERAFEKPLYRLIRIKQWKNKLPTFMPETFSVAENAPEAVVQSTCRAELTHFLSILGSLFSVCFSFFFGAAAVFWITGLLGAVADLVFLLVQRFNRPRLLRLQHRKEAFPPLYKWRKMVYNRISIT